MEFLTILKRNYIISERDRKMCSLSWWQGTHLQCGALILQSSLIACWFTQYTLVLWRAWTPLCFLFGGFLLTTWHWIQNYFGGCDLAWVSKGCDRWRTWGVGEFLALSLIMVPKCVCRCLKGKERNWLREEGWDIVMRKVESHLASYLLLPLFKTSDEQEIK